MKSAALSQIVLFCINSMFQMIEEMFLQSFRNTYFTTWRQGRKRSLTVRSVTCSKENSWLITVPKLVNSSWMANEQWWWNVSHFRAKYKHAGTLSVERFIYYCHRDNWKLNLSRKLLSHTIQKLFSPNKLYKMELEWFESQKGYFL